MVMTGENCRTMNRSPGSIRSGSSSVSRASADSPGGNCLAPSRLTVAMVSAVKEWKCTRARSRNGLAERSRSSETLMCWVGWKSCGSVSIMPRARSVVSIPARFSAVRWPAMACIGCSAVHLHAAHTHQLSAGMNLHLLILVYRTRDQRASNDRAEAFHGEDAIDGQAKDRGRIFRGSFRSQTCQLFSQLVQARTGFGADRDDGRVSGIEERALEEIGSFHPHHVQRLRIDHVGFGDHGYPALQAEHAADIEVLARLGLDGLVGRDHQQDNIDTADAGQHVANKALVAGHIDETDRECSRHRGRPGRGWRSRDRW